MAPVSNGRAAVGTYRLDMPTQLLGEGRYVLELATIDGPRQSTTVVFTVRP